MLSLIYSLQGQFILVAGHLPQCAAELNNKPVESHSSFKLQNSSVFHPGKQSPVCKEQLSHKLVISTTAFLSIHCSS